MPTYAYTQSSGSTTVEYNITPDFSAGFNLSGSVTVTGRVKDTSQGVTGINANFYTATTGGTSYMYGYTALSGSVNQWASFTITMTKSGAAAFPSSTQATKVYLRFSVVLKGGLNISPTGLAAQSGYLFNWHTSAHIADGSGIVRCDGNGIQRPDGNRLRFENFQVLTHASSTLNKITFQVMQSGASSGSSYSVPSNGVTIAKLTSSPYTEATPSFFPDTLTLSSAYSYTILISFTDAYETTQQSLGIPRGAPILDFSLADKGGLAVGQYSSSTDTEPRFEVAYPTYLAGGLVLTPGETRATKGGQLMMTGIRFGRHKFTKTVPTGSYIDDVVKLNPEFNTDKYVVLLTPMGKLNAATTYKVVDGQTAGQFSIRCLNNSGASAIPVYNWLAIEGSTDDSSDLTEGGSPATYPENILRGTGSPSQIISTDTAALWSNGTWGQTGGGSATVSIISVTSGVDPGITKGFSFKGNNSGNKEVAQYKVPFEASQVYTASCWARVTSGTPQLSVYIYDHTANTASSRPINKITISNTSWKHYCGTITFSGATANSSIHFGIYGAGSLDLCGFKLEKGTNSNPTWTASPYD